MTDAIIISDLTKRFRRLRTFRDVVLYPWQKPDHVAVDNLRFSVERGVLFGLLGQNGAGKTTLIRMLSTTLLPTEGSATVSGHDVISDPRAVRSRIGLVSSDERSFYFRLTGRQNLAFFAALFHVPRTLAWRRVAGLVAELDLNEYLDRPYHGYSSGTRQKLSIVRGLLTDPEVVFMDEPTRSLDPLAAHAVRRFVAERLVEQRGATVLLATHSTVEAEELCQRLALIRNGRLAALGTIGELRHGLGLGERCSIEMRSVPAGVEDTLRAIGGIISATASPPEAPPRIELRIRPDSGALGAVLAELLRRGVEVTGVATRHASLEEIYLETHGPGPQPAPAHQPIEVPS
jgi:ABC-2 type transport system ATP-binding protein